MKIVVQRVGHAEVKVDHETVGKIGHGLLIFVGVTHTDTENDVKFLAEKAVNLRIFNDHEGKMNRSLLNIGGEALIVSQFTLYGDAQKGRRPSFTEAAGPDLANTLYLEFIREVEKSGVKTATGIFGADMKVELLNDGPVTIIIDSK